MDCGFLFLYKESIILKKDKSGLENWEDHGQSGTQVIREREGR